MVKLNHAPINLTPNQLVEDTLRFVESCRINPAEWRFASSTGGEETLYASTFACMIFQYVGHLQSFSASQKQEWAEYLNSWQDPDSGYFMGPELVPEEIKSRKHSFEHVSQHLAAHVLPALSLLDAAPKYPLTFAHIFLDLDYLQKWLEARDWRDAWLEGNNLIFVGQFLIHLRDVENISVAQPALDLYFDWLDKHIDPATGLWGSNGYCSPVAALYGGYHQLIAYYYENRPVQYPERLIDVALSLQHADGGFHPDGGGGACEDTDTVDILVNMYKQTNYKHLHIRIALRRGLRHILQRRMPDGGFVYRLDKPFVHMGIQKTQSPANRSNLFPTWFRIHTIALISEILTDEPAIQWDWQFNNSCSMGWHRTWNKTTHRLSLQDRRAEEWWQTFHNTKRHLQTIYRRGRNLGGKIKRRLLRGGQYG